MRASLAIDGSSATHGGHQVAQTLRKTVLPRYFANETARPSRSYERPVVVGRLAQRGPLEHRERYAAGAGPKKRR